MLCRARLARAAQHFETARLRVHTRGGCDERTQLQGLALHGWFVVEYNVYSVQVYMRIPLGQKNNGPVVATFPRIYLSARVPNRTTAHYSTLQWLMAEPTLGSKGAEHFGQKRKTQALLYRKVWLFIRAAPSVWPEKTH